MNRLVSLLLLLPLLPLSRASELEMKTAFLPLYIEHAVVKQGEKPVHFEPRQISFVSRGAEPETTLSFLRTPFIPSHDETWREKKGDSNLISMCGISLTYVSKKLEGGGFTLEINLDVSSFSKPEGLRISAEEIIDLVRQAVSLNFPKSTVVIRNGEQGGADQPATDPHSKLEGDEKPKPNPEARSQ